MACWWWTAGRLPRGRCCPGNGTKKSTGAKPDLPGVREHRHRVTGAARNGLRPLEEKSFRRGYGEQAAHAHLRRDPTSPRARHHTHARLPENSGRRGHGGGKLTLATFVLEGSAGRVSEDQKSWWRPGGHRGPWASPTTNTPKTTWGREPVIPPCIAISVDIYAKTGKQKTPPPAPDVKSLPGTSASKKS